MKPLYLFVLEEYQGLENKTDRFALEGWSWICESYETMPITMISARVYLVEDGVDYGVDRILVQEWKRA